MNLDPLMGWGIKMLALVETPEADRPPEGDLTRLEEKGTEPEWHCHVMAGAQAGLGWNEVFFVRFVSPGLVLNCFTFLSNKLTPSLVHLAHRDQGGFLHVQSILGAVAN